MSGRPSAGEGPAITARIVEAAWLAVRETGPEHLSLDRVARDARASKQTIYARFSGKPELLRAVLDAQVVRVYSAFAAVLEPGEIETVIVAVTRRSADILIGPDTLMLDRLVDWLDGISGEPSIRSAVYQEFHRLFRDYLEQANAHYGLKIGNIDSASALWLDSLIGHVRGIPRSGRQLEEWAHTFARYFVRAVSGTDGQADA